MKDQLQAIREALELERFACIHESLNVPDHLVSALTALTQLEAMVGSQEPVAWLHPANSSCVTTDPTAYARGIPLYTAAPVAQQPQEIEVQCPVCNHKFYEWPNDKQPQAEAVPGDVTDAMVDAYLKANDAYWRETDTQPKSPAKWRNGNPKEATRVSLAAAIAQQKGGV